jgi:hypothetical protein
MRVETAVHPGRSLRAALRRSARTLAFVMLARVLGIELVCVVDMCKPGARLFSCRRPSTPAQLLHSMCSSALCLPPRSCTPRYAICGPQTMRPNVLTRDRNRGHLGLPPAVACPLIRTASRLVRLRSDHPRQLLIFFRVCSVCAS